MVKKDNTEKTLSGLPSSSKARRHYDIYAILEAPQELYFGDEKEVNVNVVEKVRVMIDGKECEKCYISPTKRRGVERRCLLWSDANGQLLMQMISCGIPNTCCKTECPVCRVFGGLITGEDKGKANEESSAEAAEESSLPETGEEESFLEATDDKKGKDKKKGKGKGKSKERRTFIGRLTHSGGVAVAPQIASEKQRAMHPAFALMKDHQDDKQEPMPYRKEYAQPGLLYPVSNHCLSIDEDEFATVAYAFLMSLNRMGAGNPKGITFARSLWGKEEQPLLVVDEYRVPMGDRPIISPSIKDNDTAKAAFIKLADRITPGEESLFKRYTGYAALQRLQLASAVFEKAYLRK